MRIFHVFYLKFVRVSRTNFVESQQSRFLLYCARISMYLSDLKRLVVGMALCAVGVSGCAQTPKNCDAHTGVGQVCRIHIAQLHPTQAGVGQLQVDDEARALQVLQTVSGDKLAKKMYKKSIPVVMATQENGGDKAQFYLVDRHHFTSALWQIGVRELDVTVIGQLEQGADFWQHMAQNHWAWLFDAHGAPLEPSQLPLRVQDLTDYPYRSLAGALEDDGFIDKSAQPYFAEFVWAQWLGERMGWAVVTRDNFQTQLKQAKQLACTPAARQLAGYAEKTCAAFGD
jgi:hypothetical protein